MNIINYGIRENQDIDFFEAMKELKQGKIVKSIIGFVYYMDQQGQIYSYSFANEDEEIDKNDFNKIGKSDEVWIYHEITSEWDVLGHQDELFRKEELAMYILVNEDIKISKGKLAGQTAHASITWLYRNFIRQYNGLLVHNTREKYKFLDNYMECQKKIILKCPQDKLEELEKDGNYIVIRDKGLTELEPNTLTCVCVGVIDKHKAPDWIKELKLYH